MNELTLNLDIHNKYGFYQIENGMKCEFLELEGYHMRCNQDTEIFKKGQTYPIHSNSNDYINYYDFEAYEASLKFSKKIVDEQNFEYANFFYFVPVEWFENGTFTLISKGAITNE